MQRTPTVLMIGYVWPELTSSAAGLRDENLVDAFLDAGWEVIFASSSKENEFKEKLARERGVVTQGLALNDSRFDRWVAELQPDYVLFDRFITEEQFGARVRKSAPSSFLILDTQDLHFLRRSRRRAIESGKSVEQSIALDFQWNDEDLIREISSIYRCDLTLVISGFEHNLLVDRFRVPDDLLFLARFYYREPPGPTSFEDRKNLVMIGNFRHPPNPDAYQWYRSEIWPQLRARLPGVETHIYGAYPPKEIMAWDASQGLVLKGWVKEHLETMSRYRLSLAPLRFGAGIKGKISDGWWSGTPVVSTGIGAEGMSGGLPWGGALANSPEAFVDAVVELYRDPEKWLEAQGRGYRILRGFYDYNRFSKELVRHLEERKEVQPFQREQNLTGRMLWYHGNRSTEYFSRWIELKERGVQQ